MFILMLSIIDQGMEAMSLSIEEQINKEHIILKLVEYYSALERRRSCHLPDNK